MSGFCVHGCTVFFKRRSSLKSVCMDARYFLNAAEVQKVIAWIRSNIHQLLQ